MVTGASFWQAWDRKDPPADPTLRLQVRIDEEPVATWVDASLDPEDLPGAVVNTFAFTGDEAGMAAPGVLLSPPEVQPGRVVLRVGVPRVVGAGPPPARRPIRSTKRSAASPAWRDVATATATVDPARRTGRRRIQLRQDRGQMEFTRKRMRDVETFRIEISTE